MQSAKRLEPYTRRVRRVRYAGVKSNHDRFRLSSLFLSTKGQALFPRLRSLELLCWPLTETEACLLFGPILHTLELSDSWKSFESRRKQEWGPRSEVQQVGLCLRKLAARSPLLRRFRSLLILRSSLLIEHCRSLHLESMANVYFDVAINDLKSREEGIFSLHRLSSHHLRFCRHFFVVESVSQSLTNALYLSCRSIGEKASYGFPHPQRCQSDHFRSILRSNASRALQPLASILSNPPVTTFHISSIRFSSRPPSACRALPQLIYVKIIAGIMTRQWVALEEYVPGLS